MSNVFISHSSRDTELASRVARALESGGYASVFLDFDPDQGIKPFEEWEQVLYRKLRAAQVVLALVTDHFVASHWCFAEVAIAHVLGKPVFAVLGNPAEDSTAKSLPERLAVRQYVDLREDPNAQLPAILDGLSRQKIERGERWSPDDNPYPGMLAYRDKDGAVFFGRENDVARGVEELRAVRRSRQGRFVGVIGASGSGKSSLVQAGILPTLGTERDEPWVVVSLRPGLDAVADLAEGVALALGGDWEAHRRRLIETGRLAQLLKDRRRGTPLTDSMVLLVLDQFEGYLTSSPASETFLWLVADAIEKDRDVAALITIRSDDLDAFHGHPAFRDIQKRWLLVEPMKPDGLLRAIAEPARVAEGSLEPGLAERLLQETGDARALPLLAFTLRELWEAGITDEDRVLSISEYEKLGGIERAVAKAAEACVGDAPPDQIAALRNAFQSLVRIDTQGRYRRCVARWQELDPDARPLLDLLIAARLLVSHTLERDRLIEISHEALLSAWSRLSAWLKEDARVLEIRSELAHATALWRKADEAPGDMWRGARLEHAVELHDQGKLSLRGDELRFIQASIKLRDEERTELERQQRERARLANLAMARALAIQAKDALPQYPQRALILATHAVTVTRNEGEPVAAAAETALRLMLTRVGGEPRRAVESPVNALLVDSAGQWLAAGHEDGTLGVWTLRDGFPSGRFRKLFTHAGPVTHLLQIGRHLACSGADGVVSLWDTDDYEAPPRRLEGHDTSHRFVNHMALDRKGRWLAVKSGSDIFLWSLQKKEKEPVVLDIHTEPVRDLAFHPSGDILVSSDFGGALLAWGVDDLPDSAPGRWQEEPRIDSLAFDPHGRFLVTGGLEGALIWRFQRDKVNVTALTGGAGNYFVRVAVNHDGSAVVGATYDGAVFCWVGNEFESRVPLGTTLSRIWERPFDCSGTQILTAARGDARIFQWQVSAPSEEARPWIFYGDDEVRPVVFLPDGRVVAGAGDGTVRAWTWAGEPRIVPGPENGLDLNRAALSRERMVLIAAGERVVRGRDLDRRAKLIDADTGETVTYDVLSKGVDEVALSADGRWIALAGTDDEIYVEQRGADDYRLPFEGGAASLDLSADGNWLAACSRDGTVALWDLTAPDGKPVTTRFHEGQVVSASFSGPKQKLVTVDRAGRILVWTPPEDGLEMIHSAQLEKHDSFENFIQQLELSPCGDRLIVLTGRRLLCMSVAGANDQPRPLAVDLPLDLRMHTRAFFAMSADERWLIVGADGSTVAQLWDLHGDPEPTKVDLRGHDDVITHAAMSSDGDRAATVSRDGTVRLWVPGRQPVESVIMDVPTGAAARVAFRGARLLTVSYAGACIWRLSIDDLLDLSARATSRSLTEDECARFLPGVYSL